MMNKIGILGGTFDPFHVGHLSVARAAREECALTQVVLLPTKVQPFKLGHKMADERDRVNMVSLVAEENEGFSVCTAEAYSEEVSYTYKTMKTLKDIYRNAGLYFIMGTDSFLSLENWYKGEELLREFSFIVGMRPGYRENETGEKAEELRSKYRAEIVLLHNRIVDVSSTEIKSNIKAGKSISHLVPPPIERYIYEHGLYK